MRDATLWALTKMIDYFWRGHLRWCVIALFFRILFLSDIRSRKILFLRTRVEGHQQLENANGMERVWPNDGQRKRPELRPAPFYVILEWANVGKVEPAVTFWAKLILCQWVEWDSMRAKRESKSDCCAAIEGRVLKKSEFNSEWEKSSSTLDWLSVGWKLGGKRKREREYFIPCCISLGFAS